MAARSNARKRAFQILFEADQRGVPVREVLADWIRHSRSDDRQPPVNAFTMDLVEGYADKVKRIDDLIVTYAVTGSSTACRSSTGTSCGWVPTS